jgi:hypothetical protein
LLGKKKIFSASKGTQTSQTLFTLNFFYDYKNEGTKVTNSTALLLQGFPLFRSVTFVPKMLQVIVFADFFLNVKQFYIIYRQ